MVGKPGLRNEEEIYRYLMPKIKKAVEYVVDKILEENEKYILELFYKKYSPTIYDRSYQFVNAWDFDPVKQSGKVVKTEFGITPSKMEYDPDDFLHGSYIGGDAREYLVDIIYGEKLWGNLFGEGKWQRTSGAFDELVKVLDKSKFDKWMEEGLKKNGIVVRH